MKQKKQFTRWKKALALSAFVPLLLLGQTSSANSELEHQPRTEHDGNRFWHHSQERPDVWISDIGTLLFDDVDGDGYYSGFSLTIDLDSENSEIDVYAHIQLRSTSEALEHLHTTSDFSVYGSGIGDEYRIDTELRSNFASDEYDVVIDIREASSDKLLDTANARGFSNLSKLPLESSDRYYQTNDATLNDSNTSNIDEENSSSGIVVTEFAGALHPILGLVLLGGLFIRRSRICS